MELSSNTSKIMQMPHEILSLIFSRLMTEHIKTARRVCRKFNDNASPYLMDTAIAGSETETLKWLEAIARHDRFRGFITTVVYSVCSLECGYATINDYHEELSSHYRGSKHQIPTLQQCEQHWHNYQNVYKDQAERQHGGDNERRIQNALRYMPNIKHVVLSSNAWEQASHPLNKLWCPSNYKPGRDPQYSHGFNITCSALLFNKICLSSLSHMDTEIQSHSGGLRSLSFSDKTPEVFRHLNKVALYLSVEIYQDLSWQIKVRNCLSIAKALESLEIVSEPSEYQIHFMNLLHTTWPKLFYLRVQINIHYDSFIIFCKNHKESLRSLHLQSICVFGGTWGRLISVIREHLKLTDAWLEDLYGCNSDDT